MSVVENTDDECHGKRLGHHQFGHFKMDIHQIADGHMRKFRQ